MKHEKLVSFLLAVALVCSLLSTVTFAASEAPVIGYREVVNGQNKGRWRFVSASAPTLLEKNAILTTHTGNISFHSFAAEIAAHATWTEYFQFFNYTEYYESAIRADMVAGEEHKDSTLGSWFDDLYYNPASPTVTDYRLQHYEYGL